MFRLQQCEHTAQINEDITPSAQGCVDCLETGDRWVHLRECLTCGHIGCCDQSQNKHATEHSTLQDTRLFGLSSPEKIGVGVTWIRC